jgi:hypothetical protein
MLRKNRQILSHKRFFTFARCLSLTVKQLAALGDAGLILLTLRSE